MLKFNGKRVDFSLEAHLLALVDTSNSVAIVAPQTTPCNRRHLIFLKFKFQIIFSYLVVLIEPKESEIGHADWFPVVLNLFPSAVYYMRDLIRHNELEILPNSLRRAYG